MKKAVLFLALTLCVSCDFKPKDEIIISENESKIIKVSRNEDVNQSMLDSLKLGVNFYPKGNYASILGDINTDRNYFKNLYRTNNTKASDTVSKYLYSKLLNEIVPHWYDTTWDFNGHTNTPNDGEIACGYFVSTTLKHLGFNLNRYKMAQAAGLDEAKLLQPRPELKIYSNVTFKQLKNKVNEIYEDGIYFVGLDNHVGYIVIKDNDLYFLHSSYCDDKVVIELAETSLCFRSNIYVFAEITTNKNLMKKWVFEERLKLSDN
jgi:hypothetical protein